MGRPKEYVRENVLKAATEVFWEKGYEGTSVSDLVEGTGLHRRSMYEEFKDKDGLFLACLDHFAYETTKDLSALLKQEPLGLQNIENFFRNRVDYASSTKFKGCLLVRSAIEQELLNPGAQKKVHAFMALTEKAFYQNLQTALERGEIPKEKDCRMLAKYLMCFLEGLMVLGGPKTSKSELDLVVDAVMSTVKK